MKNKPIDLGMGEFWYKGCFIQEQNHPKLKKYHVFQDTIEQKTVGTCYTLKEAKKLAELNEITKYNYGAKAFL